MARIISLILSRRDPTTERHGGFDLLRVRPGPMHPSLGDLEVPGSPGRTISIPNLVRTPARHSPLQLRALELKRSSSLRLPCKKTESRCVTQAALQRLFTGAIPLLSGTGALTCSVSGLGRCTPP
ncbi:unnamed protein product [Pleuronectes platessa]|uniref:Uncharacterized protein n=1 Tax=Pleuronectes platessa TaxID=8262 RepID=A0A9N7V5P8_PLEPL|nr:unnamed protein product [Pleuronectes platessa]